MTRESMQWLNNFTLIGNTEKRGHAWHYAIAMQGDEPNHYPGPIPVEDVRRRLFGFKVEPRPIYIPIEDGMYEVPDRKAWVTSDTAEVLGIFSDGYQGHQYDEWLVHNVENILDDTLGIGSAGLLRNRAQAWVSVEVPENITTPEGVTFRPNLVAATSFDGSLATTYKRTVTNVVCDNTLAWGLGDSGGRLKVKHTRYSGLRIADAREALEMVFTIAEDFQAEVAKLVQIEVTRPAFNRWLDVMVPLTDAKGEPLVKRALTLAEGKRDDISRLYFRDDRAAPWNGTALGVMQAFDTYQHHEQNVRGSSRVQRNREAALTGKFANEDDKALAALALVAA